MKFFKKETKDNILKITIFGFIKIKHKMFEYGYSGDYSSWEEASRLCSGYDNNKILEKTLESVLKVKTGEAVFERDSFIFNKIQYSYPMLSALFKIAVENNNELNIVDFGGALGSHYFQNKEFLKPVKIKNWSVVEQKHYIDIGNEKIADGILNFKNSIDEVLNADTLILSSVLQYLPNPWEWIDKFIKKGYKYILIDRTAFSTENRNRLTLQKVPPSIYEAEYPAWFLDENKLLSKFESDYETLLDFDVTIDLVPEIPSKYKGFLFKRK